MAIKPGSMGLAALVMVCSICALVWPETTMMLQLAPGNTFAGQHALWNLVTCAFVETNLLMLVATVLALLHLGSIVETRMHTEPWLVVVAVGVLASSVIQAFLDVYLFLQTRDEARLFSGVGGTGGLLMTVAVATVQALGEDPLPGAPMIKASFLPGTALVASAALNLLGLSSDWSFAFVSLLAVWIFLRYSQARRSGGRGDARPEFAFERLWPARIRPVVGGLSRLCAATVGRLPCFQLDATTMGPDAAAAAGAGDDGVLGGFAAGGAAAPRAGGDGGLEAGSMSGSLSGASLAALAGGAARLLGSAGSQDGSTGGTSAAAAAVGVDPVAERRRAKAMAALDKRLQDIEKRRKARVQRGTPTATSRSAARTGGGEKGT